MGPSLPTTSYKIATHCPYCAFQCGMLLSDGDGGVKVGRSPLPRWERARVRVKTAKRRPLHQRLDLRRDIEPLRASSLPSDPVS